LAGVQYGDHGLSVKNVPRGPASADAASRREGRSAWPRGLGGQPSPGRRGCQRPAKQAGGRRGL